MEKIPTRQPRIDQGHISPQRLHFLIYIDLWFWGKMWPGHVLSNWVNPVNNRFKSNEVTVVSRNRHRNRRERQEEMQRWVMNRSRIWQRKDEEVENHSPLEHAETKKEIESMRSVLELEAEIPRVSREGLWLDALKQSRRVWDRI